MDSETSDKERPSFEEMFGGKDVALGKEIVENLQAEGLGVPVYQKNYNERKTSIIVDRKPGEEDRAVREKTESPKTLLGIILPTANDNEYIYFGIQEEGLVLKPTSSATEDSFSPRTSSIINVFEERFSESILSTMYSEIILREDDKPNEFNQALFSAVDSQREDVKRRKDARADSRRKLKGVLFND